MEFDKQRHYGFSEYSVHSQAEIQVEIMKNGPVTAQIDVYEDFFFYKSGKQKNANCIISIQL